MKNLMTLLEGKKTYLASFAILLLQAFHQAGLITDAGASTANWSLAAVVGIALRSAIKAEITNALNPASSAPTSKQ